MRKAKYPHTTRCPILIARSAAGVNELIGQELWETLYIVLTVPIRDTELLEYAPKAVAWDIPYPRGYGNEQGAPIIRIHISLISLKGTNQRGGIRRFCILEKLGNEYVS